MSDNRKYRKFTAKQKVEIVLASFRGDRSIAELCREHDIAESLLRKWRDQALEAAAERFESGQDRSLQAEQRRRIAAGAGAWPQDLRAGDRGGSIARRGVSARVARSRELVARGGKPAVVARVLQISRQAIYRTPTQRPAVARRQGPPVDPIDRAIVEVAVANQTDGRCAREPQAGPGGQPQAGAASDARAAAASSAAVASTGAGGQATSRSRGPTSSGAST